MSLGLERRSEEFEDRPPDAIPGSPGLGEFQANAGFGKRSILDLFATANAPIVVDAPLARLVEIGAGIRFTRPERGEGFSSYSGNLRWAPVNGIELYGQFYRGGRTPSIVELFGTGLDTSSFFVDPCGSATLVIEAIVASNCQISTSSDTTSGGGGGDGAPSPEEADEPAPTETNLITDDGNPSIFEDRLQALSVGNGFVQENFLTFVSVTGNPALGREKVHSELVGLSANMSTLFPVIPGELQVSADWRDHRITDGIIQTEFQLSVDNCYKSARLSDPFCGVNPATGEQFIQRDLDSGQISEVQSTYINGGYTRSSGLDAELQYTVPLSGRRWFQEASFNVLYSYLHRFRTQYPGEAQQQVNEGLVEFPRHQFLANAALGSDELKTVWSVRRRGSAASTFEFSGPEFNAPAVTYVDASLRWRPNANSIVYFGVENLFDTEFPIVAGASRGFFFEHYDVVGRRYFAGVKAEF